VGDTQLPRAGLLRYPEAAATAPDRDDGPLSPVLAGRGITPVSYDEWLRIETAEVQLAQDLGRGERVKLHNRDAIWSACRPPAL
jgi:ferredoxin--NADP+ reductase